MLRALFISLSENRWLRGMAERSAIGQRLSSRFVAGTQVDDALRVTQTVNQKGLSVSVDNLGENVTNAEEARASAQLYHQMLDEISSRQLNANVSLKLTHMGLDVDEKLARDLVTGLVAKAAAMNPRNFVRVDMEGSPYTQRTLDFVHELHRMPGHAGARGRGDPVVHAARGRGHRRSCWPSAFASACAKGLTRSRKKLPSRRNQKWMRITSG